MRRAPTLVSRIVPLLVGIPLLAGPTVATASRPERPSSRSLPAAPIVAIQPLGHLDPRLVHAVADRVAEMFAVSVVVLPPKPLPESALYRPRMRYRGERLLRWLDAREPPRVTKVLGLMSRDLSVTKGTVYDWGVMGVAELSRRAGAVSIHRLRGHSASEDLVTRRARQVTLHELGHTFGLSHCRTPGCIMNDARGGIGSVDRSSGRFCWKCRERLRGVLRG